MSGTYFAYNYNFVSYKVLCLNKPFTKKRAMNLPKTLLLISLIFTAVFTQAINSISINAGDELLANSITAITINDVQQLLQTACNCEVSINNKSAKIQLVLPEADINVYYEKSRFEKEVDYPYFRYPDHDYTWTSKKGTGKTILQLESLSHQGISFGLYGLLQEQLGFAFYHPKETLIPNLQNWPIPPNFKWEAKAKFDKKGFHLHTQHPIELTEALHNPDYPNAINDITEYIDWLVRNGQTFFEFCLLESIRPKKWIPHARTFVDYTHDRGLIASVDLSLHMIQQKSFQLYHTFPKGIKGKKAQIAKNMEMLFQVNWDVWNMEFATAEFIAGNYAKKEEMRLFMLEEIKKYNAKLMGRVHVVKHDNEVGKTGGVFHFTKEEAALDKERGTLIHTVMFYSITEPNAPVYENENQRHQYDLILKENKKRETWYYPESAYWVTFDSSVPMLLLPYLNARLDDINTMHKDNIKGHITFSSGWEWGYWLIDWSIARWSWEHKIGGEIQENTPCQYLEKVFNNAAIQQLMEEATALQQDYIKDQHLIPYLVAQTVVDESRFFKKEFHPRPKFSYKYLRNKAYMGDIIEVQNEAIRPLEAFAEETKNLLAKYEKELTAYRQTASKQQVKILQELLDGIAITGLRSEHRANTLRYLISIRAGKLLGEPINEAALAKAVSIREEAMLLVKNQEQNHYRYNVRTLATKRKGHTSYGFGYLYPVNQLHFWQREEGQAEKNKYKVMYKNIWNIPRIIGLWD